MTQKDLNRNFSRKTVNALTKKGARIYSKTRLPKANGGEFACANGETGYKIDDNGTSRIMSFMDVLEFVKSLPAGPEGYSYKQDVQENIDGVLEYSVYDAQNERLGSSVTVSGAKSYAKHVFTIRGY